MPVLRRRWYPDMPPMHVNETIDGYTDRLTGADGGAPPYDHVRNRRRMRALGLDDAHP